MALEGGIGIGGHQHTVADHGGADGGLGRKLLRSEAVQLVGVHDVKSLVMKQFITDAFFFSDAPWFNERHGPAIDGYVGPVEEEGVVGFLSREAVMSP